MFPATEPVKIIRRWEGIGSRRGSKELLIAPRLLLRVASTLPTQGLDI